jgi:ribosomal protein S18 acetylase RimI-like enzyme
VSALLEWGAERGATTAHLQVLADNVPALELYAGLGFTTHHAYRYLAGDVRTPHTPRPPRSPSAR